MNKSGIEWCDHTWNPITGCRHGCSYCYADKMSLRFCGNMKRNMVQTDQYRMEGDLFVLDKPFMNEDGKPVIYPFGFEPTLHIYRYDTLDKLKQGQNIFVGAMADIFGAGIDQSVLVRCNLEYPAFVAWIEQNKPSGLEIINTGQDMEWLKKHPDMLFPDKSNKAAQWFHIVQHRGQARYYKEHQLEILLLGRRKADGNYVGKDNIYTNSAGITRYSPLAEWRHEDILAYIHYYDVKLPPIYDWEKGYLCGTHPWPARQYMETEQQGWKEVYDIDKTIVENAAQHFDGAREFLKAIK